jgi:hypothetical protein
MVLAWARSLDPEIVRRQEARDKAQREAVGVNPEESGCPAVRQPLSAEDAVLRRDLGVLRREAADALASLGAAHALISSARLAQLQAVQNQTGPAALREPPETLIQAAREYQGWQSDQVRLFDALNLVLQMRSPRGRTLELIPEELLPQARQHLSSLATEYERTLLTRQMGSEQAPQGRGEGA